ncbi:MAG TPA: TolC family protein [Terriglobales bacterium]|jgi:outer membrane protein TolC|nr:TolC family protein [Terriglobales bacterium]
MKILRLISILTLVSVAQGEPLPFRQAVDLAVKRSALVSAAEQNRAHQAYLAAARMYIPQLVLGSGLAKSWGFPLSIEGSAPTAVSVNTMGYLINPGHREVVRAAHAEWDATAFSTEDKRQQAILDTALTYTQLDRLVVALHLLRQQEQEAVRAEQITAERVQAGVEPQLDLTRARLATARVRVSIAQVEGSIDVLRNLLSQLTGVPAPGIETVTESIPQLPQVSERDDLASRAASINPAVKLAFAQADAKLFRAHGEHKQLLPTIDFVGQYGLLTTYNNYQEFFKQYQRHNGTVGVMIRFPFFNMAQRARAAGADAEAVQARHQADDVKNSVSNQTRKLQRDIAQLAAAREVARLEYQLARADVDAVQTKVQAGSATLRDEADARLAEGQKYSAYLDASYQLEQAQMQLLRSTGELEKWALAQK